MTVLHGSSWSRMSIPRTRSVADIPVVTIFGAGVCGLSLAHELVERGFGVQIVEAEAHPDREYAVRIGGLAANQYGRIPAELERLHPYLFSDDGRGAEAAATGSERAVIVRLDAVTHGFRQSLIIDDHPPIAFATPPTALQTLETEINKLHGIEAKIDSTRRFLWISARTRSVAQRVPAVTALEYNGNDWVLSTAIVTESVNPLLELRKGDLKPVQRRHPIPERIQFERSNPTNWPDTLDDHGIPNTAKICRIALALNAAYTAYEAEIVATLNAKPALSPQLSNRMRKRESFFVEICGHTDAEDTANQNRTDSTNWAKLVRDALQTELTRIGSLLQLGDHAALIGLGNLVPIGNPRRNRGRRACNRVEIRIVEHVIPGEHGYRYFPRFYRNLFDTMKRTPILDAEGHETGETAFDRLVPTEAVDLASKPPHGGPLAVPIRGSRTLEGLRKLIAQLMKREDLRVPARDVLRFQAKMIQYATSSEQRRRAYEKQTWAEFVDLPKYGEEMRTLLNVTPESLVGMNASETDARTQGTVLLQLLLDMVSKDGVTNATLSGPTSEAWMEDWKRYLTRQGVRFFRGKLTRIVWNGKGDRLLPITTIAQQRAHRVLLSVQDEGPLACTIDGTSKSDAATPAATRLARLKTVIENGGTYKADEIGSFSILAITRATAGDPILVATSGDGVRVVGVEPELADQDYSGPGWDTGDLPEGGPDYYVLAVPYLEASTLVWGAEHTKPTGSELDGCFGQLLRFDRESGREDGKPVEPERDAWGRPQNRGGKPWPLRDLSGIQFYFDRTMRVGSAHTYYLDATWGLSSISQLAYWRERVARESAFLGQLSVDLGRWYWHGEGILTSAWRSSRTQIATEVWQQIEARLPDLPRRTVGAAVKGIKPSYFHLDDEIRFRDGEARYFSRAHITVGGGSVALLVDGTPVSGAGAALAADIEARTGCASLWQGTEIVVGPRVAGLEEFSLIIDAHPQVVRYRLIVNTTPIAVTTQYGWNASHVADAIANAINATASGVNASARELPDDRAIVALVLTRSMAVSAVAIDPATPKQRCVTGMPNGAVRIEIPAGSPAQYVDPDASTPASNAAPFVINAAGCCGPANEYSIWEARPGHRLDPGESTALGGHGRSARIFYKPTQRRWLMAGNHMATWTRLSTMESANESARHAALAIVHAVLEQGPPASEMPIYRGQGSLLADPLPSIMNPEDHEIEDAEPLKRIDERLAREGFPHFMEILGVDKWIDGDPKAILEVFSKSDGAEQLGAVFENSALQANQDWNKLIRRAAESLRSLLGIRVGAGSEPGHGD